MRKSVLKRTVSGVIGTKSASDVSGVAKSADGVVVGSTIVKNLNESGVASTLALVKNLSSGLGK